MKLATSSSEEAKNTLAPLVVTWAAIQTTKVVLVAPRYPVTTLIPRCGINGWLSDHLTSSGLTTEAEMCRISSVLALRGAVGSSMMLSCGNVWLRSPRLGTPSLTAVPAAECHPPELGR
jgi:hypothetical protein